MPTLWFDDGVKSTFTVAYPVMKKYGLTGIVSVITSVVGKELYAPRLRRSYPTMSVEELKILINDGWEIASHSVTHRMGWHKLSLQETEVELRDSKKWIIENVGVTPTKFVPPRHLIRDDQRVLAKKYYSYIRPPSMGSSSLFHWLSCSKEAFENHLRKKGWIS